MADRVSESPQASSAEPSVVARSEWTARRVVLGTLTVIGVALIFLLLYRLYMVVFLLFTAIALHVALSPVVEWLYRRRVPRRLGVMGVYLCLLAVVSIAVWFGAPPLVSQAATVGQDTEQYYLAAREFLIEAPIMFVRRLGRLLPEEFSFFLLMALVESPDEDEEAASNLDVVWVALRTLFAVLAIFILAYYWTLEGDTILRKFVMKAPTGQHAELRALIGEVQAKIGAYFRGTAILSVIVGVASTTAYLIIGLPNAILLGVVMAIFEFIPIIGPILGAIPAILLTLAVAPDKIFWVIGALLLIQGVEGNVLVPRVMDQSVGVNPIVSLLAVTTFGALFGIGGAILAIPLAAIVQILVARLLFNTPVDQTSVSPSPPAGSISRSEIGVLRVETQEVIKDLHRNSVGDSDEGEHHLKLEGTADQLEALAVELDAWLSALETQGQPGSEDVRPARGGDHPASSQLPAGHSIVKQDRQGQSRTQ